MSFLPGLFGPPDTNKLENKKDIDGLIKALDYQKDPSIRLQSARALGRIGDVQTIDPLIHALRDPDPKVCQAATEALKKKGEPAVLPLIAVLDDPSRDTRMRSADILGELGNRKAVTPLFTTLKDPDRMIRIAAAEALGRIGGAQSVEPLCAALRDADSFVRKTAAEALGRIGDARAVESLSVALIHDGALVRCSAAVALGMIGDSRAVEPLIMALSDGDSTVGENSFIALTLFGDAAVSSLIAALEHPDKKIRKSAIRTLGKMGNMQAMDPLIATLKDTDPAVRKTAVVALGRMGNIRAKEPLIAALKDVDPEVRRAAVDTIGKMANLQAAEPLALALKDPDPVVRKAAIVALGRMENAHAKELLIAALKDPDARVRESAVEALGRRGDKDVIRLVKKILSPYEVIPVEEFDQYAQDILKAGEFGVITLISCLNDAFKIRARMGNLIEISIIVANKTNHPQLIRLLLEMRETGKGLISGSPKKVHWMPELRPEIIGNGKYGWQALPGSLGSYSPTSS